MKTIQGILLIFILAFSISACKNEANTESQNLSDKKTSSAKNDSKALAGTGVEDISENFVLDQTQIIQPGNVGFNFKTHNAFRVYITALASNNIDFEGNQILAIFADETVKETFFKVESFDSSGEQPILSVTTIVTENTVPAYRPSYVVTVPRSVEGFPIIKVDGAEIPVFIIE